MAKPDPKAPALMAGGGVEAHSHDAMPAEGMSWSYLKPLLVALPAYARVDVRVVNGGWTRLMARDMPGTLHERRFTNLDSGTEWFLDDRWPEFVTAVQFQPLQVEVSP